MVAPPVTISEDDIRKTCDNFDGSDLWFEWRRSRVPLARSPHGQATNRGTHQAATLIFWRAPASRLAAFAGHRRLISFKRFAATKPCCPTLIGAP
jgi:hypothetical protein